MAETGTALSTRTDAANTEEALLANYVRRVTTDPIGYFTVHLHLSELRSGNRQAHFITIAARSFESLVASSESMLFQLSNGDLMLVCRNVPVDEVDACINSVRSLFSEDPLVGGGSGEYDDRLASWYDLSSEEDNQAFIAVVRDLEAAAEARIASDPAGPASTDGIQQVDDALTAQNLATLDQKLKGTQVDDLIRNQVALRVAAGGTAEIVFREFFFAISELKARVAPGVNLFASPWLFQYLTETLDKRVLVIMADRSFDALKETISLNLNIGTVLSRDFKEFNRRVGDNARKLVIELQVIDVFADMNQFADARDFLQGLGYRVLIDGLNPLSVQFFDPALLKTDFVKVGWSKEFTGTGRESHVDELREVISHTGRDAVILARVDSEHALKWGLSLGISRFQGYFVDNIVRAMAARKRR